MKYTWSFIYTLVLSVNLSFAGAIDMPVGYSLNINSISEEKIQYAKSLGIQYIECAGIGAMLDRNLNITESEEHWRTKVQHIKSILKKYDVQVWSIHMPFSKFIDISIVDEETRKFVVERHLLLASILSELKPEIILFHPSFYIEKGEREQRYTQLSKSVHELYQGLKKYKVQMVVENMLGPALEVGDRERPLLRTVEECKQLFRTFPKKVGLAVDMCHIGHSELLIQAFGSRVKTLHVSDGDGTKESHYLPCNGLGSNNWNLILEALENIKYKGVFMYECKFTDEKELTACYSLLKSNYANYKLTNTKRSNEKL